MKKVTVKKKKTHDVNSSVNNTQQTLETQGNLRASEASPIDEERAAGSAMQVNLDKIKIIDPNADTEYIHPNDKVRPDLRAFPNQVLPELHKRTYFKAAKEYNMGQ